MRNIRISLAGTGAAIAGVLLLSSCGGSGAVEDEPSVAPQEADSSLSEQLPADIKDAGVIRVATDPTYPPFESQTAEGDLEGFDIDLANAIGQTLGVKVEFVSIPFDAIIPGLAADKADMAMSSIGDSKEREATVDFATYYQNGTLALVKTGNPLGLTADALCGARVGVVRGSLQQSTFLPEQEATCAEAGEDAPVEVVFQNSSQAHLAVQSGRADAVLEDAPVVRDISSKQAAVFEAIEPFMPNPNPGGVAFPKDSELLAPVQGAINNLIEAGTYADILEKWKLQDIAVDESVKNGATS